MSEAKGYIEALGQELGMNLEYSNTGTVTLEYQNHIFLLQWNEAEKSFIIYVELGHLGGYGDMEILRKLLEANFLFMGSKGGALSYDTINNMVGYNYSLPVYGVEPQEFIIKLNAVVLLADEWKEIFVGMKKAQEEIIEQKFLNIENEEEQASSQEMLNMQFIRV